MQSMGYATERLPNLKGEMFECQICSCVVKNPKQCLGCGDMFCTGCINEWIAKKKQCPKRCAKSIQPITSPVILKLYNDLDIICEKGCGGLFKMVGILAHQNVCTGKKCWNNNLCKGSAQEANECCSLNCLYLRKILLQSGKNVNKMYKILQQFEIQYKKNEVPNKKDSFKSNELQEIKWVNAPSALNIVFTKQYKHILLKESPYLFRTVLGNIGFTFGIHYWQIIADPQTQNQLKIGVSTTKQFDLNTAFCDHPFGFAYYGLGQLRSNSNAAGVAYGKRFKKEGVLGVCLNMNEGNLSFSLDGDSFGVAFTNEALKKGPIYPAVALLHCAACSIRGQLPVPAWFK